MDKVQRRDGSAAAASIAAAVSRAGWRAGEWTDGRRGGASAACDRDSACKSFSSRSFAVGVIIPFRVEWRRPPVYFRARARAPLTHTHVDPPTARRRRPYVKRRVPPSLSSFTKCFAVVVVVRLSSLPAVRARFIVGHRSRRQQTFVRASVRLVITPCAGRGLGRSGPSSLGCGTHTWTHIGAIGRPSFAIVINRSRVVEISNV